MTPSFSSADVALLRVVGVLLGAPLLGVLAARFRPGAAAAARGAAAERRWAARSAGKRWAERFFVRYSAVWIAWFGAVVVSGVWAGFGPREYMAVGLAMALPCALLPLARATLPLERLTQGWLPRAALHALLPPLPREEAARPLTEQFWFKANAWVAVISFVGNYVWTHYFYRLLRATYTFRAHRVNFVPVAMFLCTHAYFCTYHSLTTLALRRWWSSKAHAMLPGRAAQRAASAALVLALALLTALTEAVTIQNFPYYDIEDRAWFYAVGSCVYSLYFVVSFPAYFLLDEDVRDSDGGAGSAGGEGESAGGAGGGVRAKSGDASARKRRGSTALLAGGGPAAAAAMATPEPAPAPAPARAERYSLARAVTESLAACMLVTLLLEAFRLSYTAARGAAAEGLLPWPASNVSIPKEAQGLPWLQ